MSDQSFPTIYLKTSYLPLNLPIALEVLILSSAMIQVWFFQPQVAVLKVSIHSKIFIDNIILTQHSFNF